MKHYFLDTNVVLDFLARREPFAEAALEIFRAGLEKRATLYVASLSFSTVYYVLRKQANRQLARTLVANLEQLVTIVAVDAVAVQKAITGSFLDFEDGLQHCAAASVPAIEVIVTRNAADFKTGTLPALTPNQALVHLSQP
ncbi:PIN domain-containing protein [Hymenobacter sp. BT664]|uniref:PIN domain-containing protein n=1 Tax=Hymenobacter montanus TaxID=2771359 RepID=A0A927GHT7_9BACT|nr:PIN domain-containing protein [Hymenobacter montanus]MBD2766660.1 PIN domain-containing protein [Hymenobacter montanus]